MKDRAMSDAGLMDSAKPLAINSFLVSFVVLFLISVSAAFGGGDGIGIMAHTATVTIDPTWTYCGANNNFTATVANNGPDTINEIRIYNGKYDNITSDFPPHTNFACGPAPANWMLVDLHPAAPFCWYFAINSSDYIDAGESQTFTFKAVTTTESNYSWVVETRDINNAWYPHYPRTIVDCTPPVTTKRFDGPQFPENNDWWGTSHWINSSTKVILAAEDQQPHPSGINSTYWKNTLVDDRYCWEPQSCASISSCKNETTTSALFSDGFETDLSKWAIITDGDPTDVNRINTSPSPAGGYYVLVKDDANITANISTIGYTNIKLSYYRKTEGLESADKLRVYWRAGNSGSWTQLEEFSGTAWSSIVWNLPGAENKALVQIRFFLDDGNNDKGYIDAVNVTGEKTAVCGNWTVYTGPFQKPEQSCHLIEYYSVDNVGWKEDTKKQCIFVDNTPPLTDKEIGEPKIIKKNVTTSCGNQSNGGGNGELNLTGAGTYVATVNFTQNCAGGVGVGIAFDGQNLWYTCTSGTDLYRANPLTGAVTASYDIVPSGGLGALAYDASRNAIWAGYADSSKKIRLVHLNNTKDVTSTTEEFVAAVGGIHLDDGLAYDAQDDTLYLSPDIDPTISQFHTNGSLIRNFPKAPGSACGNSGLAIGGKLLYEGFNGCSQVIVVNKTSTAVPVFNFSTQQSSDPAFRDEDLECDTNTFASIGKQVMWSVEAYDNNRGSTCGPGGNLPCGKRRALAFQIPPGSCGIGGKPVCEENITTTTYISNQTPITFTCRDPEPHPVDHGSISYRYRVSEDCKNWNSWTQWFDPNGQDPVTKTIYLQEDSCHELEYYCTDALGNKEPTKSETDIVDSKPPVITKAVMGPQIGNCPPQSQGDVCYIQDHNTTIEVNAYDPEPHPIGEVTCDWDYTVTGGQKLGTGQSGIKPPFNITFPEDSAHELEIVCKDALQNRNVDVETFLVDSIPPNTTKTYGAPFVTNGTYDWITSDTLINLTAKDNKVGVDAIYWRATLLGIPDSECIAACRQYGGNGTWNSESGNTASFNIHEQSCHLIEYYSIDKLGNDERNPINQQTGNTNWVGPKKQCVFVDNTPPATAKTIGEPKVVKGQIVLTFEDLGYKGPLPKNYSGLNWTTDWWYYNWTQPPYTPHSGVVRVYDNNNTLPEVKFLQLTTFEGAWFAGANNQKIRLEGYDGNTLVGTSANLTLGSTPTWLAANFPGKVDRVVIHLWNGTNSFVMDDFTYNTWGETYITRETPITLTCNDQDPHPVHNVTLKYRYFVNGVLGEDWNEIQSGQPIYFPQDSNHTLEYYCVDGLGNREETQSEVDIVDTVAPEITKTIIGPQYGNCPPKNHAYDELYESTCIQTENGYGCLPPEGDRCYVDNATTIHVEVKDPEPHPVEGVTCDWSYTIRGKLVEGTNGGQDVLPPFDIKFPEESIHDLTIVCRDALGNRVVDEETFIADHTPPVTTKGLEGPQYPENAEEADYPRWINSKTNITFSSIDPYPHPSGVNATYTKVTLVADEYCRNQTLCEGDIQDEYLSAFDRASPQLSKLNIGEESCHMIEYYSVDNVEKQERVKRQCLFVDNTPPTPVKTVGKPGDKIYADTYNWTYYPYVNGKCWNGRNDSIDCWKVTTMTPITMSCNDTGNHPVDRSTISFKVDFDGSDTTLKYCNELGGIIGESGYCIIEREDPITLLFKEESEHNLKFYCTDALGNKGPVDDEKFKVEGSSFEIKINKKWNLISVPFVLLNDSMHKVFDNHSDTILSVWTYDALTNQWYIYTPDGVDNDNMNSMMPGNGYWVLASNDTTLLIGGSLFSPAKTPPSKTIVPGWNLIGYWGTDNKYGNGTVMSYNGPAGNGRTAYCELYSLATTMGDVVFNSLVSYWEPYNPNQWNTHNPSRPGLTKYNYMDPGAGYWLFTNREGEYVVSTDCGIPY